MSIFYFVELGHKTRNYQQQEVEMSVSNQCHMVDNVEYLKLIKKFNFMLAALFVLSYVGAHYVYKDFVISFSSNILVGGIVLYNFIWYLKNIYINLKENYIFENLIKLLVYSVITTLYLDLISSFEDIIRFNNVIIAIISLGFIYVLFETIRSLKKIIGAVGATVYLAFIILFFILIFINFQYNLNFDKHIFSIFVSIPLTVFSFISLENHVRRFKNLGIVVSIINLLCISAFFALKASGNIEVYPIILVLIVSKIVIYNKLTAHIDHKPTNV